MLCSGFTAPVSACFALVHTTLKENCSIKKYLITRPNHCTNGFVFFFLKKKKQTTQEVIFATELRLRNQILWEHVWNRSLKSCVRVTLGFISQFNSHFNRETNSTYIMLIRMNSKYYSAKRTLFHRNGECDELLRRKIVKKILQVTRDQKFLVSSPRCIHPD